MLEREHENIYNTEDYEQASQSGRRMSQAAHEFTDAARELTLALNRFLSFVERGYSEIYEGWGERLPGTLVRHFLGAGGLPDDEAGKLADEAVHRAREELGWTSLPHVPGQEEIEEWSQRREERRNNEDQ
jgi:hypothetical protein